MAQLAKQLISMPERRGISSAQELIWLQTAAGWYPEAQALIDAGRAPGSQFADETMAQVELFVRAKAEEAKQSSSFEAAFTRQFEQTFQHLDDKVAVVVAPRFRPPSLERLRQELYERLDKHRPAGRIAANDGVDLCRRYVLLRVYESIAAFADKLVDADNAKRFIIDDVLVKTPDGASINAVVVRPKGMSGKLPTALEFTIYASETLPPRTMQAATRGYVSVMGFTRGKRRSPDPVVPYERDGEDARALIDWISKQPWSDGRVGMYGGSYNGFAQWGAVKRLHPALKTIVPYCPNDPGHGLPMTNNVFITANYGWAFYTTNHKYLDNEVYGDAQRWQDLPWNWYRSGRSYRELDQVDGQTNPWLQRWLQHPSYDAYWQGMTANGRDYDQLTIPVLAIDGYFDDGQINAVRRLQEHYRHRPNAEHYLVIGPYDHFGSQAPVKPAALRGYTIDPVAQLDTFDLTFQWFDYIFKGAARPALLKDKINYQVMGANVWKHAPSIAAMSKESLKLYLTGNKLMPEPPQGAAPLKIKVDFADRATLSANTYPGMIVTDDAGAEQGLVFASEPFDTPVSVNGLFSATLRLVSNKKDMDIALVLYEAMPDGKFFHLSYTVARASHANDMSKRTLLTPDQAHTLTLDRTLLISRQFAKGSRLLLVLDVNRGPFAQINYGTGKDVSDESIADAGEPLQVQWLPDSYITVPISR